MMESTQDESSDPWAEERLRRRYQALVRSCQWGTLAFIFMAAAATFWITGFWWDSTLLTVLLLVSSLLAIPCWYWSIQWERIARRNGYISPVDKYLNNRPPPPRM